VEDEENGIPGQPHCSTVPSMTRESSHMYWNFKVVLSPCPS